MKHLVYYSCLSFALCILSLTGSDPSRRNLPIKLWPPSCLQSHSSPALTPTFLLLNPAEQMAIKTAEQLLEDSDSRAESLYLNPQAQDLPSTSNWQMSEQGTLWGASLLTETPLHVVAASESFKSQNHQNWATPEEHSSHHESPDPQAWDHLHASNYDLWHRLNGAFHFIDRLRDEMRLIAEKTTYLENCNKTLQEQQAFDRQAMLRKFVVLKLERNFAIKKRDQIGQDKARLLQEKTHAIEQQTELEKKYASLEASLKNRTDELDAAVARIARLEAARKQIMDTNVRVYARWAVAYDQYDQQAKTLPKASAKLEDQKKATSPSPAQMAAATSAATRKPTQSSTPTSSYLQACCKSAYPRKATPDQIKPATPTNSITQTDGFITIDHSRARRKARKNGS